MTRHFPSILRQGLPTALLLGAFSIGTLCARPPAGQSARTPAGQPTATEALPPGHFMAGSERAVPLLNEISESLKRIDERLERLEKLAIQVSESPRQE